MTALEQKWAAAEAKNPNVIPPMTDPLGKYWDQPEREEILIDADVALMERSTFDKLHDYTRSHPTGCYPGKMWRAQYGVNGRPGTYWFLCWFGFSSKGEKFCSNNYREIVIL